MNVQHVNGREYRLPRSLSAFQLRLYVHLIEWKWKHITREPGCYGGFDYDAILPEGVRGDLRMIYPEAVPALLDHRKKFPFRAHTHFNHMASSQAAVVNLFLPILRHPRAAEVLGALNPHFARLATEELDGGFRFEFWDEPFGTLGDKTAWSGTDADLAIAYYNHRGELCLWLIEHKLAESGFTPCGGLKSRARQPQHDCTRSLSDILSNKNSCYHHDVRRRNYWTITEGNRALFLNHTMHRECPFQDGKNQLWRNLLLALAVEQDARQRYRHGSLSVVKHPDNPHLEETLSAFANLIGHDERFSIFSSVDVVRSAEAVHDSKFDAWARWYRDLYMLR